MASPLLSLIKNEISKGLGPQMLDGTLRRASPSSTLDALGDPSNTTYATYSMKGMVDTYSAMYRSRAGIPETDVKLLVIAGTLSVTPQKDDQVKFRSKWYQVRAVDTDPAEAAWEMRSYEVPDPTSDPSGDPIEGAGGVGSSLGLLLALTKAS